MEIHEGFISNNFEYVSDQPHLTVTGFPMFNPLISRLILEVGLRENKPVNVMAKKSPGVLDMPIQGMFYHSPLNGIIK